jgi:hypothetical protein
MAFAQGRVKTFREGIAEFMSGYTDGAREVREDFASCRVVPAMEARLPQSSADRTVHAPYGWHSPHVSSPPYLSEASHCLQRAALGHLVVSCPAVNHVKCQVIHC